MKWTTKDGRVMDVKDMTDSHLLNAHRYCMRAVNVYNSCAELYEHPVFGPRGEMAQYAAEQELDNMFAVAVEAVIAESGLSKEIERRGLKPLPLPDSEPLPDYEEVENDGPGRIYKLTPKKKGVKAMKGKTFYIAGVQHHNLDKCINELSDGDTLDLVPEPTNQYDPNAVRIEYEGIMTGYVPRKFSSEVAAAIEVGKPLSCTIIKLNPAAKPWEQCLVEVTEVSDEVEEDEGQTQSD